MKRVQYLLWFAHEHVSFRLHVRFLKYYKKPQQNNNFFIDSSFK